MKSPFNIYRCPRGHETITIDLDEGTTPFMIGCRYDGCDLDAHSSFYRVDMRGRVPTHAWYKPPWWHRLWLRFREPATYDHVRRGGLLLTELSLLVTEQTPRLSDEKHLAADIPPTCPPSIDGGTWGGFNNQPQQPCLSR